MSSQTIPNSWSSGEKYEQYVGRWSRQVATQFLAWLQPQPGQIWLDLGCGTGALSAAILAHCQPQRVIGVEPSGGFLTLARQRLGTAVQWVQGSGAQIPLQASSVDWVVSGLVLNFIPDAAAAVAEMARVVHSGGRIAAYVWDYAGGMEMMRFFWDAVRATDPNQAGLDEGDRFPICHPGALQRLFSAVGRGCTVQAITIPTHFASFADYWRPFLGGQGPGPAYVATLDRPAQIRLESDLRARLPVQADGSIHLTARAWAVRVEIEK